ncbi:MAG: VanZ family protein [Clostridia bacterium]|nr:VanZ family protein [Clostridia bacterium]
MKRKLIYTILTIIWLTVIFIFSSMNTQESNNKSKQTIKQTVEKTTEISESIGIIENNIPPKKIDKAVNKLNFPLRKCAHATEYAVLAILIICTINVYTNKNYSIKKILLVILICFIYSLTDEYHQSFVPGRSSLFTDCLIDTSGSLIACVGYTVVKKIRDVIK